MIFIADYEGKIINSTPETVYQGSAGANTIYLVAPFEGAVKLNFVLPNGLILDPYIMTPKDTFSNLTDPTTGSALRAFSYSISNEITQAAGVVKFRFTFYSSTDYEGATVLATSQTSFLVSAGVITNAEDIEADDTEATILAAFSALTNYVSNGAYASRAIYQWNETYTYNAGEITFYPVGDYGAFIKSVATNNTANEPFTTTTDDDGVETYEVNADYWEVVTDFNKIAEEFYQLIKDQVTLAESWTVGGTGARDGEDTDNAKYYAEQAGASATAAGASATAAAESETNAAASAKEAAEKAESVITELTNYYTKTETNSLYGKTIAASVNTSTYVCTFTLKAADGTTLSTTSIDLPIEELVVSGSYNSSSKSIILTLKSGSTVTVPIGDLVSGLVSESELTTVKSELVAEIANKASTALATQTSAGLMSAADKKKLDGFSSTVNSDIPLASYETDGLMSMEDKIKLDGLYYVLFLVDGEKYAQSTIFDGSTVDAPDTEPTKSGYFFDGWSLIEDGELISFPFTPTANTTIYAVFTEIATIGFTGMTDSSGDLTWTDGIEDRQSSAAYTTSTAGNYESVTGALDDVFPFKNIEEYTDDSGNAFIKFPKMWIKWVKNDDGYVDGIKISRSQQDEDYFVPDCFLNPDGSGEYNDCFYMGKYEGSGSSSLVYSATGATPFATMYKSAVRTGCRAYGDSSNYYNGYQMMDLSMLTLYNFLCMLYYRTQNIQTVFTGRTSTTAGVSDTGTTDGVTGLNGRNTSTACVKMLGVENPYGNASMAVDGVYLNSYAYIQRYPLQFDDSTTDATYIGFSMPSTNGYITYFKTGTADATKSYVLPYATSGSSSTYCGDYAALTSATASGLTTGGNYNAGTQAGIWYMYYFKVASTGCGTRLCLRPTN